MDISKVSSRDCPPSLFVLHLHRLSAHLFRSLQVTMHPRVKANRFRESCLKFPALIEQIFPDDIFPIAFERLHAQIMESNWQMLDDDEKREVLLVRWLNQLTTEIAKFCEVVATREWAVGNGAHIHLIERRHQKLTALATAGLMDIKPTPEDAPLTPPTNLSSSAQTALSSDEERRLHLGIGFSHSDMQVFGFNRSGFITSQTFNVRDDPSMLVRLIGGLIFTTDVDIVGRGPVSPEPVVEDPQVKKPLIIVLPASKGSRSAGVRGKKRKTSDSGHPQSQELTLEDKENSDSVSKEPTQKAMKSDVGARRSTRIKERVLARSEMM